MNKECLIVIIILNFLRKKLDVFHLQKLSWNLFGQFHGHDKDKFFQKDSISSRDFYTNANANVSNSHTFLLFLLNVKVKGCNKMAFRFPVMDEVNRIGRETESRRQALVFIAINHHWSDLAHSRQNNIWKWDGSGGGQHQPHLINNHGYRSGHWDASYDLWKTEQSLDVLYPLVRSLVTEILFLDSLFVLNKECHFPLLSHTFLWFPGLTQVCTLLLWFIQLN